MTKAQAAIVGAGRTRFGELWNQSAERLVVEAGLDAIKSVDKGIGRKDINAFYIGSLLLEKTTNISTLDAYLSRELSVHAPIAILKSGSSALYNGVNAIKSGLDVVCVGGIEKMTDAFVSIPEFLTSTIDQYEADAGFTYPGLFAAMTNKYMLDFNAKREAFAKVPCKNHYHGMNNEFAQFRNKMLPERVLSSPLVADPIRTFECAPISDGAAAVIITKPEIAKKFTDTPIYIVSSSQATDHISLYSRHSMTKFESTELAMERALKESSIGLDKIQIAEVHDSTPIEEVLFLEDAGFVKKGLGWKIVDESIKSFEGSKHIPYVLEDGRELVINCGGGLKADGHPIGATGVRQVYEAFKQLRNEAGKRQVSLDKQIESAVLHDTESSGAVSTIHILRRFE
ncbi:MAG: thiolase domain-containing protein [Candidatus Parvarchaeota archaeon]|nr:thiolase domain-containing protein [Candidatus Jingweiarchaeum tengchongense]MCW1298067.1 thiolase domain-containing protein [Candidatus Jingweiarchaeum tengchongense]MCW1300133.1 thiolase domain-containing protein [Candidatus Jingweiarchaeum tengchongense]MCW1309681.1 thiolase domain-containing protein [Candidatus Jingweiarchaeum tengchongense]MCW1310895.1 thiolase domain-containing protein [Candidatus Jingweiarchaeum tengchongense]